MGNRGREGQVAPLRARASGLFPGGHSAENPPALQTGCPFPRLTAAVGPVSTRENRGLVVTVTLTRRSVRRRAGRSTPRPRHVPDGPRGLPTLPGHPARHDGERVCTRAHARTRRPQEGRPPAASRGGPRAGRPTRGLPAAPCLRRHFLSGPRPASTPPRLQMAGARNRLSPEEAVQCLARLRVRLAGQGACLPPPAAWHPVACPPTVCFGGPWLGRTTRPSGWWSSWPRRDRGLRGPRGNDAGGHPQSDLWPSNTGPPLGPPPQQGDAKHLCICVHGAHTAARPPRGHASPQHTQNKRGLWKMSGPGSSPIPTLTTR